MATTPARITTTTNMIKPKNIAKNQSESPPLLNQAINPNAPMKNKTI